MNTNTRGVEVARHAGGAVVLNDLLMGSHPPNASTSCASRKHKTSLDAVLAGAQCRTVSHIGHRIKKAREAKGWSQGRLAGAINKGQTAISSWERGRTEPGREDVARIAEKLGIPLPQIELAADDDARGRGYPLIGKIGAGGEGLYTDDYAMGAASDYIEPLPGMDTEADVVVLETDGDSMAPLVFDGDLAFFGPVRKDVDSLLNRRVMARLADGRRYFKILRKGTRAGLYTLRSLNPTSPDIEDVKVSWVLPYRGSRPRD